jgi:hypothetical protein
MEANRSERPIAHANTLRIPVTLSVRANQVVVVLIIAKRDVKAMKKKQKMLSVAGVQTVY